MIRATRKTIAAAVGAALLGAMAPAAAWAAQDDDVIAYRQNLMKAVDAQTAALGMILSGAVPPDNLVSHLDTIALIAASMPASFEPKVVGGESSAEVWAKWADFSERINTFAANTAKVAKIAREQGQDAIMSDLAVALSCKACHDVYRTKK
jgi:cytochrome c556